jgi:hypothetical protein
VSQVALTDQLTPAYTGTNSYTVIENFKDWGEAGNFGFTYDVAQFWTARNLDGDGAGTDSAIAGVAYLGTVCNSFKYHILEDYTAPNPTGSGYRLRVLVSHEIAHNLNSTHDAANSPFIMNPSGGDTRTWSSASISAVQSYIGSVGCLTSCANQRPLTADFVWNPLVVCTGNSIEITDHTLGGPVAWTWTASGGSPTTFNLRNPTFSFASPGIKNIILETNNGLASDVVAKSILISNSATVSCSSPAIGGSNAGIKLFTLNTIYRTSGGVADDGNTYVDFSCTSNTVLLPATTYIASAEVGTLTPEKQYNLVQFFIDYNNDGDFNDADEFVYGSELCYIGEHSFSFTTPAIPPVTNKILRARVIANECLSVPPNACFFPLNGQVEDYGVVFMANTTCSINYWTGAVNTAWENAGNWSCGSVPVATTDVIIKTGVPNYPVVNSNANCKSLYNALGTALNIQPGFKLVVSGTQ